MPDSPATRSPRTRTRGESVSCIHQPAITPSKSRGNCRERAQQTLWIPVGPVEVTAQQRAIEPRAEIAIRGTIAGHAAGHWDPGESNPVCDEHNRDDGCGSLTPLPDRSIADGPNDGGGRDIAPGDACEHAWNTNRREPEEGKGGHEEAESPQHRTALQDATPRLLALVAERDRDTDDEQEEREDQIGWCPAVPLGVQQRRIDRSPVARVVDDDHAGHRQAAKDVQRSQPFAFHRDRMRSSNSPRRLISSPYLAQSPARCASSAR